MDALKAIMIIILIIIGVSALLAAMSALIFVASAVLIPVIAIGCLWVVIKVLSEDHDDKKPP